MTAETSLTDAILPSTSTEITFSLTTSPLTDTVITRYRHFGRVLAVDKADTRTRCTRQPRKRHVDSKLDYLANPSWTIQVWVLGKFDQLLPSEAAAVHV